MQNRTKTVPKCTLCTSIYKNKKRCLNITEDHWQDKKPILSSLQAKTDATDKQAPTQTFFTS